MHVQSHFRIHLHALILSTAQEGPIRAAVEGIQHLGVETGIVAADEMEDVDTKAAVEEQPDVGDCRVDTATHVWVVVEVQMRNDQT